MINKKNKTQNNKGCSICIAGKECYSKFFYKGKEYIQYDYRTLKGKLFSCVKPTLEKAREAKDNWGMRNEI